jgi:uncharacterized protein YecE (DUF72 family)
MTARPQLRIGTSGYQYDHWKRIFYPDDLPKKQWFDFYSNHFDTVEINNTFYHLPQAKTFDDWREAARAGFRYVLKFSRYGTHMKKLKDATDTIGLFLERAERLKTYLGPILVQLPPHWTPDFERLEQFLDAAPHRHRWAVEFRQPDWLCKRTYDILRSHNAALCIHDMIPDHPRVITADWVYLRFHGTDYAGDYSHQALNGTAGRIRKHLRAGRDVWAFFNNDIGGHAVHNARDLHRYVTGE